MRGCERRYPGTWAADPSVPRALVLRARAAWHLICGLRQAFSDICGLTKSVPRKDAVSVLNNRQLELFAEVWPNGVPNEDRIIFEALPIDQRRRVLERLDAVWQADRGGPLGALADAVGLKHAAFFNLRRAWRRHSLAGLIPHETRVRRRLLASADDPLRKRAVSLLRAKTGARNVDIAKLMIEADPTLVSAVGGPNARLGVLQRLERLVQAERRSLAMDAEYLTRNYGRGLALDLTAVSIILNDKSPSLAVAALLVETASGLVLGSALGRANDYMKLQLNALADAIGFLKDRRGDLLPPKTKALDLTLMLSPKADARRIAELLSPCVNNLAIGQAGGFSLGRHLVQNIGPQIGRIILYPRRTLTGDADALPVRRAMPRLKLAQARAYLVREVERHNAERVEALKSVGIIDGLGIAQGRMVKVISEVTRALRSDSPRPHAARLSDSRRALRGCP
jgi:hypothetical protein